METDRVIHHTELWTDGLKTDTPNACKHGENSQTGLTGFEKKKVDKDGFYGKVNIFGICVCIKAEKCIK